MKSVLVTGGTVRLGRVISEYLRNCDYRVLTTSSRGGSAADIVADFREPLGAAMCYSSALRLLGGVPPDAVVNNAALFLGTGPEVEAVNLIAPKKLTMMMAGRETSGRGCVINILDAVEPPPFSSTNGLSAGDRPLSAGDRPRRNVDYCRTKRELREYTRVAAAMFSDTLRVNSVSPGPIDELGPVMVHEKADVCPLGRPKAFDVAKAVVFLIENESVTGIDIPVDGGLTGCGGVG